MKRKLIFSLFFLFGYLIFGQTDLRRVIADGDLTALNSTLEWSEVWDLNQSELRILRNTIFAKYGYIFRSEDLQRHFSQFTWYRAINANVDNQLTAIDNANITQIQSRESSLSEIILYQESMLEWIQSQNLSLPVDTINIGEMSLFQNPVLHPQSPEFLAGDYYVTAFCFAMGRFLSNTETVSMIQKINAYIRAHNAPIRRQEERIDEINTAVIFNPSVLFLSNPMFSRVYRTFENQGIYLIVIPNDRQATHNIQTNQVLNGTSKSVLIMPWSVNYYVYKIANNGSMELVDTVAAN